MKNFPKLFSLTATSLGIGGLYYYNQQQKNNLVQCKSKHNYFNHSLCMIPHPEKKAKGGEDAAYVDDGILIVADGVGGWASRGVDPAIYSNKLVQTVASLWKKDKQQYRKSPKQLLINGAKPVTVLGSSTLVICTLEEDSPTLRSAYMGDSGYAIYRPSDDGKYLKLFYASEEQQKSFNFPYQLGYRGNGDDPNESWTFKHQIKNNDIVVVGSDGLFDNLDSEQIRQILEDDIRSQRNINLDPKELQSISNNIANRAYTFSLDKMYVSPFAQKARQYRINYIGGKSDDITVVVAQIKTE